jgi:hypothetical protein
VRAVSFRKIAAMDASKLAMELLGGSGAINRVLSLLALLVQKYKYRLKTSSTTMPAEWLRKKRHSFYLLYWYKHTHTDAARRT